MRRLFNALVVLSVLAGCAGEGTPNALPTTSSPDAGSVAGRVTDEQFLPLADVEVGIVAVERFALSDATGAFLLTNVPAGTYDLVASRVGHKSATARVTVETGQVVDGVELTLQLIAPPPVPFSKPFVGRGFISCAVKVGALTFTTVQICEADPSHDPFYEFEVSRDQGLVAIVLELVWTPTLPGTSTALRQELWKNPTCDTPSTCAPEVRYGQWSGGSPIKTVLGNVSQPFHNGIEVTGPTRLTVYSHVSRDNDPLAVLVVQQEVKFYVTAFYHSVPRADYTLTA